MPSDNDSSLWYRWRLPLLALAVMAIVVVPFVLLNAAIQDIQAAAERVDHTRKVESILHELTYEIRNVEAASLALASGIDRPSIRQRIEQSTAAIPQHLQRLAALTRDNSEQQIRVGRLQANVEQRLALSTRVMRSAGAGTRRSDAEALAVNYPVRLIAAEILAEEQQLLAERQHRTESARQYTQMLRWGAMSAQLLLLGLVAWFSQRQIAQRTKLEQQARRVNARAQAIMQSVREPILLTDQDQRVVMHNAAFSELYGVDDDGAVGQPLAGLGDGAWRNDELLQRLQDVFSRDRELWDFAQEQRTEDGSVRSMLVNAVRMELPHATGTEAETDVVLITVSDITAQKAAEDNMRELARQLEGKVEQVSEVNRELEAFSYTVSHDLRAPLRHVAGFADKLARQLGEDADDKSRHYMEVIGNSARRMSTLIDDLLVYSRLGRSALRLQPVDMQSMVADTRAMLDSTVKADTPDDRPDETLAETSDHRIEWQIGALPILVADENMMRQVWQNLLGNAVKYSAKRERAIIEVDHERGDDGNHHFSVRDNGAGFDMQYAGKLFGVFQRMHKVSDYPGTGIGLASVRRVLLRHGGRIWAESALDAGSTFHFTLPATLDHPTESR